MTEQLTEKPWHRRTWAERGPCKKKPCKRCRKKFQPPTSGHLFCSSKCAKRTATDVHRQQMRAYRTSRRAHYQRVKHRWDLKRYGLTEEAYDAMLAAQGGVCKVCRRVGGGRGVIRKLAVDHCHRTGRVRGLLCHRCNGALGMVQDDPVVLAALIAYLEASQ